MIKLQIIGNLGKDCIVSEVNGKSVINFSVAHSERYKDAQGNQKERTTWVECAYWTDRTNISPYLVKGKTVYVEGSPSADAYTNKDGQVSATLRLRVQSLQLLGGTQTDSGVSSQYSGGNAAAQSKPAEPTQNEVVGTSGTDDLPF
jgi:single-strand DNA-binding protein